MDCEEINLAVLFDFICGRRQLPIWASPGRMGWGSSSWWEAGNLGSHLPAAWGQRVLGAQLGVVMDGCFLSTLIRRKGKLGELVEASSMWTCDCTHPDRHLAQSLPHTMSCHVQ